MVKWRGEIVRYLSGGRAGEPPPRRHKYQVGEGGGPPKSCANARARERCVNIGENSRLFLSSYFL